jgi:hypothetical protein
MSGTMVGIELQLASSAMQSIVTSFAMLTHSIFSIAISTFLKNYKASKIHH